MLENRKSGKQNKHEVKVVEKPEVVNETTVEDLIDIEVRGTVENCEMLNVRSHPDAGAEIVSVIPVGSIVTISDINASPDFYKILIGDLEGFCMKQFIKVQE